MNVDLQASPLQYLLDNIHRTCNLGTWCERLANPADTKPVPRGVVVGPAAMAAGHKRSLHPRMKTRHRLGRDYIPVSTQLRPHARLPNTSNSKLQLSFFTCQRCFQLKIFIPNFTIQVAKALIAGWFRGIDDHRLLAQSMSQAQHTQGAMATTDVHNLLGEKKPEKPEVTSMDLFFESGTERSYNQPFWQFADAWLQ